MMTSEPGEVRGLDTPRLSLLPGQRHALAEVGQATLRFTFRGRQLRIDDDSDGTVLFPTDVGLALIAGLNGDMSLVLAGKRVLDIGCGSGLYTVAAVAEGAQVTALDVSAASVAATMANVAANGLPVEAVEPVEADLRSLTVTQAWDVVLANPPHYPDGASYSSRDGLASALVGGADGRALYDVLVARADELIAPGGHLVLAHSSLTGISRSANALAARGYECRTALVVELDMPLRRYAAHRDRLLARLYQLRGQGTAQFCGLRFEVHLLIARRPTR
ncbi:methyltransferase [Catellatospora chokoriensis]|uniref:Methyltransferase small domain-containing protein n=1 Tax=Catellatospora chokoriensis TaxID=310353 RepID=A0A8J3KEV8_9ACTN|nr:methyltransferase [Catellatospora chokoriensis]GIF94624.1 hypothetical protein Cch02nite_80680 [Catellatospora chokoriensis]